MQDNDFEKQVHQKMAELNLLPSEAVWERVEKRLHRKEKRKRWIIWFPLLLSGLSIAGYLVLNTGQSLNSDRVQSENKKFLPKQTDKNIAVIADSKMTTPDRNKLASSANKKFEKKSLKKISENILPETQVDSQSNEKYPKQKPYHLKAFVTGVSSLSGNNIINMFTDKKSTGEVADSTSANTFGAFSQSSSSGEDSTNQKMGAEVGKPLMKAEVKKVLLAVSETNTSLTLIHKNPFPKITVKPHPQKTGLEWGLSFQAGRSSLTNGTLHGLFNSGGALTFSNNSNQFLANPGQAANRLYREPYPASASTGFSAGAFMIKNLSRRVAISFGVNYTLFSTSTTVGKKIGSLFLLESGVVGAQQSLTQSFRLADAGSYQNKYHYIDVPVMMQTRLTTHWKLPLQWDMGFSLSRLIASNALHFDSSKGIYYNDNQLLNKTHVNIITGLHLKLPAGKKFSLQAGPQFQYDFSHVLANETTKGNHFLFIGLKANLLFGQKMK